MGYKAALPSSSPVDCVEDGLLEVVGRVGVIIKSSVIVVSMTTTPDDTMDVVVIATDVGSGVGGRPTTQQQNNQSNQSITQGNHQLTIFNTSLIQHIRTSTSSVGVIHW